MTLIIAIGTASTAAHPVPAYQQREVPVFGPVETLAEASRPDEEMWEGRVVLARDGDGATVFLQDAFNAPIQARSRSRNGTWSPPETLPCADPVAARTSCSLVDAVVGARGELIALLDVTSGRRNAVAVTVRRQGRTTWSRPTVISGGYRVLPEWGPTIHASRRGAILVTFGVRPRGRPDALVAAYIRPGQRWERASYHRLRAVEYPEVSGLSRRGHAVVIYSPDTGISAPVRTARFEPDRGWASSSRVGRGWSENWTVAMGPGGRAVAAWLETTSDRTGSSLVSQELRVRQMSTRGRWTRPTVLARGSASGGSVLAWVHGEVGVAWANDDLGLIRAAIKRDGGRAWRTTSVARGRNAGPLRSIDLNGAGDLVLEWLSWTQGDGYGFGLALRTAEGQWSAPRTLRRGGWFETSKDVLARRNTSALVAYREDPRDQVVARRVYVPKP